MHIALSRSAFIQVNRAQRKNKIAFDQKLCQWHCFWRHKRLIDTILRYGLSNPSSTKDCSAFRKGCSEAPCIVPYTVGIYAYLRYLRNQLSFRKYSVDSPMIYLIGLG